MEGLPEWEVLRLYKRLLIPVRKFIAGPMAPEFFKRIRSMDVAKHLDVSTDGEISVDRASAYVGMMPNRRGVKRPGERVN